MGVPDPGAIEILPALTRVSVKYGDGQAWFSVHLPTFNVSPPEKLETSYSFPLGSWIAFGSVLSFTLCHEANHRGCSRLRRGDCLSPAPSRASFGVSGCGHDVQANPKGSWHGRFLLVPFSFVRKKMNNLYKSRSGSVNYHQSFQQRFEFYVKTHSCRLSQHRQALRKISNDAVHPKRHEALHVNFFVDGEKIDGKALLLA